jgi:hypothetical protein
MYAFMYVCMHIRIHVCLYMYSITISMRIKCIYTVDLFMYACIRVYACYDM